MTSLRVCVVPLEQMRQREVAYASQERVRRLYRRRPVLHFTGKQLLQAFGIIIAGAGIVSLFAYWILTAIIDALGNLFGL